MMVCHDASSLHTIVQQYMQHWSYNHLQHLNHKHLQWTVLS